MTKVPSDFLVAGRDSNRFLLADPGTDPMRPAYVHDLDADTQTPKQPLQVWFKWAEWEDATQAEYEQALAESQKSYPAPHKGRIGQVGGSSPRNADALHRLGYVGIPAPTSSDDKLVTFASGLPGKNGASLVGYKHIRKQEEKYSKYEGGMVGGWASDMDRSDQCATCDRKIVHVFYVRGTDGKVRPFGREHLHSAMGWDKEVTPARGENLVAELRVKQENADRRFQELEARTATKIDDVNQRFWAVNRSPRAGNPADTLLYGDQHKRLVRVWAASQEDRRILREHGWQRVHWTANGPEAVEDDLAIAIKSYPTPHVGLPGHHGGSAPRGGSAVATTSPANQAAPLPADYDPQHGYVPSETTSFERAAHAGKTSQPRNGLNSGVTESYLENYVDDGAGVWKAIKQLDMYADLHDGNCEVAAYRLNQLLDMDIVPPTVFATRDGVPGTSQKFLDHLSTGNKMRAAGDRGLWYDIDPADLEDILVLDTILGNHDRHNGNWGLDARGKLIAIDHGHSEIASVSPATLASVDKFVPLVPKSEALNYAVIAQKFTGHKLTQRIATAEGHFWQISEAKLTKWRKISKADCVTALAGCGGRVNPGVVWHNLQRILKAGYLGL